MKRFFTKKSVACIFVTILLFGFFSFNTISVQAATTNNSILTSSILNPYAALSSWIGGLLPSPTDFITGIGGSVATAISYIIQAVTIPLASIGLSIAGSILDFSVQYTIYGTGFSTMSSSIQGVWTLIRDTANICFIFILLYAAIQQIITGATKKSVLVAVIISAVLINFSLFFTKIVIDAGNLVATAIYNQITVTAGPSTNIVQNTLTGLGTSLSGNASQIDLSGRLMDGLGLKTMWDSLGGSSTTTSSSSVITGTQPSDIIGIAGLINSVLRVILITIATFVFMALALLLIGRFVMLVILMATSPVGFLFEVIPGLGGTSKEWRNSLFNQVLMAPAIMFFMLLTIRLSQILTTNTTGGASATSPLILFFNFFLIAFLLLKAVNITKKMSGPIASFTDKISSVATGLALGAATGGTALIARQTIGRGANALATGRVGQSLKEISSKGGFAGGAAKIALGGIKGTAKSTFDVRATGAMKGTLGAAAGIAGMSVIDSKYAKTGEAGTGYAGLVEKKTQEAVKQGEEFNKSGSSYQKKFVDEQIVEKLKIRETDLQKQADNEKDPAKKSQLESKLGAVSEQRKSAQNNPPAETIGKTQKADVDFSAAEKKINDYKKQQQDLQEKIKNDMGKASKEELEKTTNELAELNKAQKEAEKEYSAAEELLNVKKELDKNTILGESKLETAIKAKEMRSNFANSIRKRLFITSLNTSKERESIAKAVEKVEDKDKVAKDKERAELAKEVAKQMKENG
jgi:hypothetical protein